MSASGELQDGWMEARDDWSQGGGDLASKNLVERLVRARRRVSNQEERVGEDGDNSQEHKGGQGENAGCSAHPAMLLEYWCEEDRCMVCQDCLIFGEHKGHTASSGKQRRFDVAQDRLAKHLPFLQAQLEKVEEAHEKIGTEGLYELNEMKTKVISCLDEMFMQERNIITQRLSEYRARLQQAISSIQSHQSRLDVDMARLMEYPVTVTIVPSTVVRQVTRLVVESPKIVLTGMDGVSSDIDRDTSSTDTRSPPASSPAHCDTSSSMRSTFSGTAESPWPRCGDTPDIKQLDLTTLDGAKVVVLKNGTPAQFYCRSVSENVSSQMKVVDKLLDMPYESRIYPPTPGQGVLARWGGQWCRARVVESVMTGWRCQLVDLGQVVTVATLEIADLPDSLVDIPAMAVSCTLVGAVGREWSEEARQDWERLVSGKQFVVRLVDKAAHTVNLMQEEGDMVERLQFLGHLPGGTDAARPGQHFSQPVNLSAAASLCADFQHISPDSILLYFDNTKLGEQLDLLKQLEGHPRLDGPPGYVQPGHAVLAPWHGNVFRATVQAVTDTTLTLFFVDFGNIDTVSWWDCYTLPTDLLFPPLATMVRLAGVRAEEVGSWTRESCDRLRKMLSRTREKLEVTIVKMPDGHDGENVEVDIIVGDGRQRQSVLQLLVDDGYACGEAESVEPEVQERSTIDKNREASKDLVTDQDEKESVHVMEKGGYIGNKYIDNRVYMTGILPLRSLNEMDLCIWAEELWGEVEMVKLGHNQVVLDFCSREAADFCSGQKKAVFGTILMEIFSNKLRLLNGVFVWGLNLLSRRIDVLNIFSKFGDIAFVTGPFFPTIGTTSKIAMVVFKDPKAVKSVLKSDEIKQRGKKLCVQKCDGRKSRRCRGTDSSENTPHLTNITPDTPEDVEVEVLSVESPEQVWVRLVSDKDRWTQLHQDIQELGNTLGEKRRDFKVKIGEKVICKVEGMWYRGRVMEEDSRVKLVDVGGVVTVGTGDVWKIEDSELLAEKVCGRCVKLRGLEPAGSGGWSGSSVDFLIRWTKNRAVFLVRDLSQAEDLMIEEVSADNPTDVETVTRISLSDLLLQRGLALKQHTRGRCAGL